MNPRHRIIRLAAAGLVDERAAQGHRLVEVELAVAEAGDVRHPFPHGLDARQPRLLHG